MHQNITQHCLKGTRFRLTYSESHDGLAPSGNASLRWITQTNGLRFDRVTLTSLCQRLFLNTGDGGCLTHDSVVMGYTELLDTEKNLYRAHPNYRGTGKWFDWCLIDWEGIDDLIPAKIH